MKVLHLVEAMGGTAHLWGKERVIHWLMGAQRADGQVDPELLAFTPALLVDVLRNEGFTATVSGDRHAAFSKTAIDALVMVLHQKPYSIVHTHGYKANVIARAARLLGAPIPRLISTSHGFDSYTRRLAIYNALDRFTGYVSNICTVTDPRMASAFPPGVNVKYVANALPAAGTWTQEQRARGRAIHNFADGMFVVGMLHRLIPQKGIAEFIEAAKFAHRWGRSDIVFAVAGDGPLVAEVQAAVNELGNVRYVGYVDPPDDYLAALDAFIQPSRSEGLSLALLQAMRAGRPIVATRVGATQETVKDGVEAMVIEPNDAAALAAAILRLADDIPYATELAHKARERFVAGFQIERQHRDFFNLYNAER